MIDLGSVEVPADREHFVATRRIRVVFNAMGWLVVHYYIPHLKEVRQYFALEAPCSVVTAKIGQLKQTEAVPAILSNVMTARPDLSVISMQQPSSQN